MKIKLCGFKNSSSIAAAILGGCDFLGFIFVKNSPRFIEISQAAKISQDIPPSIAKVAVVVDANFEFLEEIANKFQPDFFQFHGNETPQFIQETKNKFPKIKIIKAFRIGSKADLSQVKDFEDLCDFFLFDGQNPGSGKKFDWNILKDFKSKKDYLLSGGINIRNIQEAINATGAKMVDISSGIEEVKGEKSLKIITELMQFTKMKF